MTNDLMVLPRCPVEGHGQMVLRTTNMSKETQFCGTWYDCWHPRCACSVLLPSPELKAQLAQMLRGGENDQG